MDFTLNQIWPTFYDYIPVYKISIQYTNPFQKISHGNQKCYVRDGTDGRDGRDGRTYRQRWYYMHHPPPPPHTIENGRGIKTLWWNKAKGSKEARIQEHHKQEHNEPDQTLIVRHQPSEWSHHLVWGPTDHCAVKVRSKVINHNWVNNHACSLPQNI